MTHRFIVSTVIIACVGAASAQTYTSIQIDSTDNLSGAGNPTNTTPNPGGGSGGTTASGYSLDPGTGRVLTFQSVTGTISLSFPVVSSNADGVDPINGTAAFGITMNVNPYDGISGVSLSKGSGFLAGVFLGSTYPGSAPPSLAFSNANGSGGIATSFTSLSPVIGQVFFIGDGLTGTGSGSTQAFNVPNGATSLYLGFTDSGGYVGAPGQFQDNNGALTANFRVVPEPATVITMLAALSGIALRRKRRV